jgi:hypothetical protein
LVTKGKPDINSVGVHPQLDHNGFLTVDGALWWPEETRHHE